MLATRVGRGKDVKASLQRGYHAWSKIRRWLWQSNLSKGTKAIVVQAVVESSSLFDCNVRPWLQGDIIEMQGMVEKIPVSLESWTVPSSNENVTGGCQILWVVRRLGHRQLNAEDGKANSAKGRTCSKNGK